MAGNEQTLFILGLALGTLVIFGYIAFRNYIKKELDKEPPAIPEATETAQVARKIEREVGKKIAEPVSAIEDQVPPQPTLKVLPSEPEPPTGPVRAAEPAAPSKKKDLGDALSNTRASLFGRIKTLFGAGGKELSDDDRDGLEEILYTSDLGPQTVERLLEAVDEKLGGKEKSDVNLVRDALREEMLSIFGEVQNGSGSAEDVSQVLHFSGELSFKPQVWLIVGVNGVGKTTTIGKLANAVARSGKKVVVAAGDTFRAAAGDQLKVWSERAQVEIFSPEGVSDPSAVAFDACQMAKAREFDVVIIDTAGRLHTQSNLMEELRKMKRVVQKVIPEGPHETLLVLDANSGQNALMQARNFHSILELSGVVLTKMDGTAKGGVAVGLACELELPIRLIGVGEGIDDLRPFKSEEFVDSIL